MIGKRESRWKRLKAAGEAANQSASVVTFQANCFPCSGVLYIIARPKGGGIVIPKKSRKLESNKFLLVESRIQGTFTCESGILGFGIRVDSSRNPESSERLGSGIQVPVTRNSVSGIQNPRRGIQNPRRSWIPLHGEIKSLKELGI